MRISIRYLYFTYSYFQMEIGDDANSNSNYGSPIQEMNLMEAVNLTTLPSSSSTTTSIVTQEASKKAPRNQTQNIRSSISGSNASESSRPPSSPDVTCSSTTPSIPSHSYVSDHTLGSVQACACRHPDFEQLVIG